LRSTHEESPEQAFRLYVELRIDPNQLPEVLSGHVTERLERGSYRLAVENDRQYRIRAVAASFAPPIFLRLSAGSCGTGLVVGAGVFIASAWFVDVRLVHPFWALAHAVPGSGVMAALGGNRRHPVV
jgi:hypothetical protein